jgi:hypothetical protein
VTLAQEQGLRAMGQPPDPWLKSKGSHLPAYGCSKQRERHAEVQRRERHAEVLQVLPMPRCCPEQLLAGGLSCQPPTNRVLLLAGGG